jgi:drug/metabolite transporter (DMT)-like permease
MSAALGYAEGGALSLEMPGWKVISWALVISSPFLLILMIWQWDPAMLQAPIKAWMSFFYLALFSQYLGFFPWYSGLAMGGVAKVSQLQYLQPFFTILFSVFLLGENITLLTIVIALIVVFTVIIGKNAEVKKKERNSSAVSSEKG